jgi:hypothetical protein
VQPFDKHTANLGELESCGANLIGKAAEAIENGKATQRAYAPAIANWNGMCAPELQAAQQPVGTSAEQASHALAWAAVATRYWATQVRAFNTEVDAIVSRLNAKGPTYGAEGTGGEPPTAGQVSAAKASAEAAAKQEWWRAYNTYVVDGGTRAAAMLQAGPTEVNVAEARRVGALPPASLNPLPNIWDALKGEAVPPLDNPLGWFATLMWGAGRGVFAGTTLSNAMDLRYRNRVRGHWRGTPNGGRIWIEPYWRMKPGLGSNPAARAAQARWSAAGKWIGRGGVVLAAGTSFLDQWTRDAGRTDVGTGERVARSATRGAIVGGAAWGGAALGAKGGALAGAAIGSAIPVLGTAAGAVVGGVVGGIVGGVVASGVANKVADYAVEAVDDVGEALGDAADAVGDAVSSINPFD